MKIAANPLPFNDLAPSPSAAGSNADYGRAFESTIRDVAKDSTPKVSSRDDRRPSHQNEADPQPAAPEARASADKSTDTKAGKSKTVADGKTTKDTDGKADDASDNAIAYLGRLLGGAHGTAAITGAADVVDEEAAGDERVIVVSMETAAADAVAEEGAAPDARGKVRLEVVHMETHFEPRSDAFVLVEGGDSNVVALATAEEGAPLSFDQALARLSARKASQTAATGDEGKAGAAAAAPAEVAVAREATAPERTKERGRSKASADMSSRTAGLESDVAEAQSASLVQKKNATEASVDKLTARLGQAAPDAADARKATPALPKDAGSVLPLASMTGQVAGRVIDALGSTLASQRPSDLPSEAYLRMTAGGAALKTLTIQLQPETLGQLDVSMRLVDGQLTLEIAATEADTAKVLAQDREGLRKLLQHVGFAMDDASITIVTRDNSAVPQVRAASAGDAAASQDSAGGGQADPRQRGRDAEPRGQGAPREKAGSSPNEGGRRNRSSANYV